jgi:mono/diheme cytochrome c family protein
MKRVILLATACYSLAVFLAIVSSLPALSSSLPAREPAGAWPHPGLKNIATKEYSPHFMDPVIFANLWRSWDAASRDAAEKATDATRRQMILERYGLLEAPYDNGGAPLGMVVRKGGSYAMSCLICHSGAVEGKTILGLPNNALDFSGLFEDAAATVTILHGSKPGNPPFPQGLLFLTGGKPSAHVEYPEGLLSASRGNFNSFTFSVNFLSLRDRDLNLLERPQDLQPLNHYLDAPPLWHAAKKKAFYSDGFAPKSVRALMQFSLDPSYGPAVFKSWEEDYKEVYDWIHTLESPKYTGVIDKSLAARGQELYTQTCARCHGTPGRGGEYPNTVVPIDVVNTDPARLAGLSEKFKQHFKDSWMGYYGESKVVTRASGYVAPPLDGIWASAPYFHNGSVPTIYHVLFPEERPTVWKVKDYRAYDHARGGLLVEEYTRMPNTRSLWEKRAYYDTTRATTGNGGHPFADKLSREQRLSVLEYLKSL